MTKKKEIVNPSTGEVSRVFLERTRRRPVARKGTPRVKSEFKDQCDINRIVERIKKTNDMSSLNLQRDWPEADFTQVPNNYTDAAAMVMRVRDQFMSLTAEKRQSYHNDPQLWIKDLEAQRVALRKASGDHQKALQQEVADEAAYRKARREAVLKPKKEDNKSD